MRVTFLGTGTSHGVPMIGCDCGVCTSPDPRDRRHRPSVLVGFDDAAQVLIDTSTDLRTQALIHGIRRVDAVVYTHSHADHIFGFDEIRRFNGIAQQPMPIYADARTMADLRRTFSYAFEGPDQAGGGVPRIVPHEISGPFTVLGREVVPVPVLHGQRPILGFRIGAFAYLTDCSAIPATSERLLGGLDVLVLSALRHRPHPTHFSLGEAIDTARRLAPARTFFTHMCHDLGHASTSGELPAGMALAYDGLVLDVSREGRL